MMRIAIVTSLVTYSVVASQPLAYLVFLTGAQRALSAPAYIELRQSINPRMTRRVPLIYLSALASTLLLLVLAARIANWSVLVASAAALLGLIIDVVLMLRENLPINAVMDRWSATTYPEDWQTYRTKWFAIFAYRQVALLSGFLALLVGAAFQ